MDKIINAELTRVELDAHKNKWGGFNDSPPGFTEITSEEFARSGFFTWCKVGMEFRQILPDRIKQHFMLTEVKTILGITLFYMNHGEHYGIANDYWASKVRYFKFAECFHTYRDISVPANHRSGIHVAKCIKCGSEWEYDTSD